MAIFANTTPIEIFLRQTSLLRDLVPGVLDGRADSVHDARIATRRIRAVVPLTHEWHRRPVADDLSARFKRAGRALGRVRDTDVRIGLFRHLESRMPAAVASLVRLRQRQERDRLRRTRKLVKTFEALEIQNALAHVTASAAWRRSRSWLALTGSWRNEVRSHVDELAERAIDAMTHATTVYFPNRAHKARIALKKFRYASEISALTGGPIGDRLLRTFKRGQDVLGDIHDRQTLVDEVRDVIDSRNEEDLEIGALQSIAQFAEAEIADLHSRFVARLPKLLDAVEEARRAVRRSHLPAAALTIATAVACAGVYAVRRSTRADGGPPELLRATFERVSPRAVSMRIPVNVAFDSDR